MAKGGKLTKLKSVVKKWNSFGSMLGRTSSGSSIAAAASRSSSSSDSNYDSKNINIITRKNLHAVYVGKSRREYLVSSQVVENPVFRELVESSGDINVAGRGSAINLVGCEVVMFEHLLWMLENGDPQPDSLDNFVEYYSCC